MRRYPVNRFVSCLLLCIYLVLAAASASADNRTQNIDLFLVVDKSLSMSTKIDAVKQYINKSLVQGLLIPGDYLVVIDFWGSARVLLSTTVGANKAPIEKAIDSIQGNGYWTDIGNALDELQRVVKAGNYPDHRKYFMLMTDGMQEAPPTSKYYSPNGEFNHAFLANTKTIQEKGWKIEILGIGTETAAAQLAKSLSGGYVSVSKNPSPQELQQKLQGFLGVIDASKLTLSRIGGGGKGRLRLNLKSSGYTEAKKVDIANVRLEIPGTPAQTIASAASVTVAPNASKELSLPIEVAGMQPGSYQAKVIFTFTGNSSFSPAVFSTKVEVNGFVRNNAPYLGGGALLLVLLILLAVLLIGRSAKSRRVSFLLTIEGDLKQSNKFVLKSGGHLLIEDTPMGFRAVTREIESPVAGVSFDGTGVRLEILNPSRLTGEGIPANVLGQRVHLKTNGLKDLFLQFDPT